jgi:hypothetical protein
MSHATSSIRARFLVVALSLVTSAAAVGCAAEDASEAPAEDSNEALSGGSRPAQLILPVLKDAQTPEHVLSIMNVMAWNMGTHLKDHSQRLHLEWSRGGLPNVDADGKGATFSLVVKILRSDGHVVAQCNQALLTQQTVQRSSVLTALTCFEGTGAHVKDVSPVLQGLFEPAGASDYFASPFSGFVPR